MASSINQRLADRKIDNAAMSRRFENNLRRETDQIVDRHLNRVRLIIERGGSFTVVMAAIRREQRRFTTQALAYLEPQLRRYASAQATFELDSLRSSLGRVYRLNSVPLSELRDLVTSTPLRDGRVLREHFVAIGIGETMRIESTIRRGRLERLSNEQIARQVRTGAPGRVTQHQSRAIVRTAVIQMATNASTRVYEQNGDILRGYQYVATLDSRTTPICARNDGRVFAFDAEYQPKPPLHWNCRSTTIPVVKRFSQVEDGVIRRSPTDAQRAAINGPRPARENYGEWLMRQTPEIQLRHLGDPERVRLFRQGNLTLTQFSTPDGELLSIERLETLNRNATRGGD